MPTPAERTLIARRKAADSGAVLVPILERLLEYPVEPEDALDFRFLDMLVRARALPRRKGVFSPSMLASCMRQSYLAKRGSEKLIAPDAQRNGYFLNGNFVHFKLQFAMWKAHRAEMLRLLTVPIEHELDIVTSLERAGKVGEHDASLWRLALNFYGDGTRPGVEVRVIEGDWGGTIDVLANIGSNYVIDFKGLRLDEYMKTVKKGASPEYRKQLVGYAGIANKVLALDPPVTDCLLVCESKSGPVSGVGSPIALHETLVPVAEFEGEVARRLRTLRHFDRVGDLPSIECVSTQHMGFQSCPFSSRCRDEVLAVQRERERKARKRADVNGSKVARSRR